MNRYRLTVPVLLVIALMAVGAWYGTHNSPSAALDNGLLSEARPQDILARVRDLHSPVTLINFWASWCEPCKEEFPNILDVQHEFEAKGLKVVFVSVDDVADAPAALAFLKEQNVSVPTFYKGKQPLDFVTHIYPDWKGSVPATVLMGADMKILDAWEGGTSKAEFESRIQKQLKGS